VTSDAGTIVAIEATESPGVLMERLTALLLTIPDWKLNYTATQRCATWMIEEADRLGMRIDIWAQVRD